MKKEIKSEAAILRQKAEEHLKKNAAIKDLQPSEAETMKLIQELVVYQTELEMLNEELVRAKEKVEAAAEKYAELYDFAPSGYFTFSKEGDIIELNLSGAKMLGKERSHLKNRQFGFFVSDDSKPIFNRFLGKVFNGKTKKTCEVTLSTKGGLPMYVCLTGIVTENGEQCLVTVVDVTGRKEDLVKFEKAIYTSGEAIFHTDREGVFTFVNPAFTSLYGFSSDEIVGKTTPRIIKSGVLDKSVYEVFWQTLLNGNEVRGELINKRKDGTLITIDGSATPIIDEEKNIIGFLGIQHDITERKLMEKEQIETQRLLSISQRLAHIGSWETELSTGKLSWSDEMYRILGFPAVSPMYLDMALSVFAPDELVRFNQAISSALQGDVPYNIDYSIIRYDGQVRIIHDEGEVVFDEQGTALRMFGTTQDITERKQKEEALRKSESIQGKMVANIGDVIVIIDQNGINRYKSPNIEKWFGWRPEEVVGVSIWENVHPEDIDSMQKIFGTLLGEPNATGTTECRYRCKDGSHKWIEITVVNLLHDPDIRGILGNYHDITERKRAEEILRSSEERYRFSLEITGQIAWSIPPDGLVEDMPLWRQYSGQRMEEVKGWNWLDSLHPDDREHTYKVWVNAIAQKCKYETEYRIRRADGVYRYFMVRGIPLFNADGTVREWVGTCIDITERKQEEQELIEAKKQAEESDRLKSAFLANMSHEIRTPMNGILGFAGLLKEPKLKGKERQDYISVIEKSGARMLSIINDIMSISKVESGQMNVNITETNVNVQIEYLYTFFRPEAEQKGLRIFFTNALPTKEAILKTDREKVFAILTNLIKNALKFTKEGSVEFGYKKKGKYLEFFVKDTGIGIRPEQKEFIFERFRQASESYNRDFEGAGLGLTISQAYVEMLGGKIWVESDLGKGSIFYFNLPYHREKKENPVMKNTIPANTEENKVENLKILIVEDDKISEMLLTVAVKIFSSEVLIARNGIDAVETCRNRPDIDLVLMDIQLPKMDGYKATRKIREFNEEVIIIAQTAFALSPDPRKSMEAGCNDYISKPIDKALLTALINKYFTK